MNEDQLNQVTLLSEDSITVSTNHSVASKEPVNTNFYLATFYLFLFNKNGSKREVDRKQSRAYYITPI